MPRHREIDTKGNVRRFPWVTDLPLRRDTVMPVMRVARRRWAIENETFRTPGARDACRSGHDFGHGGNHPADVLATLAMPAFPTDRVQRHCQTPFRKMRDHRKRILRLRGGMRSLFRTSVIRDRRPPVPPWRGTREDPNRPDRSVAGRGRPARPVVVRARNGIAGPSRANGCPPPDHHPTGNCYRTRRGIA